MSLKNHKSFQHSLPNYLKMSNDPNNCFINLFSFLKDNFLQVSSFSTNFSRAMKRIKGAVQGTFFRNLREEWETRTSITKIELPSGGKMPVLGFGTWQVAEDEIKTALDAALEAGYRHIDCAPDFFNEKAIGNVLKKWIDSGKVKREELFIVSKLPPSGNRPGGVEKYLKKSLSDLQLDYLDLYLIHLPLTFEEVEGELIPFNENGEIKLELETNNEEVWAQMEQEVRAGKTRAIGLSNFNVQQIKKIIQVAKIPVSNLQIEINLYFQQNEIVDFCKSEGVTITAYSPLGSRGLLKLLGKTEVLPDLLLNPTVEKIADKYGKAPAQILLRFLLQKGVAAIPKSATPHRIRQNIDLFDWKLDSFEMIALEKLDKGPSARVVDFVSFFKGIDKHPEFPF